MAATSTLAELRQECKIRLMDFEHPPKFLDSIYDYEINRQLDIWTRDTDIIKLNYLADIIANVNPTILTPLPGYQMGQILNIAVRENGQTVTNLKIRSPEEMYQEFVDWPDTDTNSTTPLFAILDFDPNTTAIRNNAIWLWPGPSQSWRSTDSGGEGGLVVTAKASTNKLLANDGDTLPMTARMVKEPLIEKTCAALLARIGNELASYHELEARGHARRIKQQAGVERRGPRRTRTYHV